MMQSTILAAGDDMSNLNPNAAPFVPTCQTTTTPTMSPTAVSPALPPTLAAYPPSPPDGNAWLAHGWLEYSSPDMVDSVTGYYCDHEDFLRAQLYQPPQQPKGDRRARSRRH